MKGIYLAGPDVFFPDAKERGKRLKQLWASYESHAQRKNNRLTAS